MVRRLYTSDLCNYYKEKVENPIDKLIFKEIYLKLMKFIGRKVVEGYDIKLGARLGTIGVRGRKVRPVINSKGEVKGVAPSWGKTKKMWIEKAEAKGMSLQDYIANTPKEERGLVYCFNEHTNGIKYTIFWYKKNVLAKNKTYYSFSISRKLKRAVMAAAYEGKEYFVIEPEQNLRREQRVAKAIQTEQENSNIQSWERQV